MKFLAITVALFMSFGSFAQNKRENVTLQDVWASGRFYPKSVNGIRHAIDGEHFTVSENGRVIKKSYTDKSYEEVLFNQETAKSQGMAGDMSEYEISQTGNWLLITTNCQPIYRHSKKCVYYLWNFNESKLYTVNNGKAVMYATLSPDEKKVGYVYENNLYYQNIGSEDNVQVTTDGEKNKILNGMSDWVYEEEFVLVRAFEWSPNSEMLAYVRFDESDVKQFQIPVYKGGNYPEMYTYKYPKTGEDNSKVLVRIFNLTTKKSVQANVGSETDIYLPRIKFTPNNQLCITKMNRWQNELDLLLVNNQTGATTKLYSEKSETYIDVTDDLTFIKDGFIISSEESGYNHLYCYDMQGGKKRAITTGEFDVTSFIGYDETSKTVYYESAEQSPLERHIYSIKVNGKKKKLLTPGAGTHSASFSTNYKYFIHTHSTINTPPSYTLRSTSGQVVRVLEDNENFQKTWAEAEFVPFEFMQVNGADGTPLNGWMVKPADFDENKEYPLLMFVYGGPGSQMVKNTWYTSNKAYFQYLAQQGYIIACFDNRGTGARGVEFKKMTYMKLGQYEVEDQIAVAKHFAKQSYVDAKRIGIFGWSYGGYMSSLCLARGKDVFSTAVAVAPVTDWRFYDNIYTERYMRRPIDNEEGYKNTAVLNDVDNLRGGNYLLVHGSFDDNVHPQNAYELMKMMVERNIDFESELYVNKNHGIYGGYTRYHLFKKITRFLDENLKEGN
ncbi:MAG: S9 family peptidase [Bacteroidetes bacterium]|nr:S9 family peptidase [Bacteroidota bacterium]